MVEALLSVSKVTECRTSLSPETMASSQPVGSKQLHTESWPVSPHRPFPSDPSSGSQVGGQAA